MWLPSQRPLPSNGALDIQQLWASGGQTREPILMKFGTQQQIRTTMTVTLVSCSQYWKCCNSSYDERLGQLFGGRVQATPLLENRFLGIGRYC